MSNRVKRRSKKITGGVGRFSSESISGRLTNQRYDKAGLRAGAKYKVTDEGDVVRDQTLNIIYDVVTGSDSTATNWAKRSANFWVRWNRSDHELWKRSWKDFKERNDQKAAIMLTELLTRHNISTEQFNNEAKEILIRAKNVAKEAAKDLTYKQRVKGHTDMYKGQIKDIKAAT
jgi:hypothetical protein